MECEIERRLKKLRREDPFAGVHTCPASSLDVPDEQSVRLVVLRPTDGFTSSTQDCAAMNTATDMMEHRGTSPRSCRNMLVFLAPDQGALSALEQEVRRYLAWTSIKNDSQDLNLDAAQNRETENSLKRSNETVDLRLSETWCWLLVPSVDRADMKTLEWEKTRLSGSADTLITRAAHKLIQNEAIIKEWAPALLLMELDDLLWRGVNHLQIKQLWDYLTTYCYLPRLASYNVLEKAIQRGLQSEEYFAYAAAVGENRYIDLKYNQSTQIDRSGFLVRVNVARAQIERERDSRTEASTPPNNPPDNGERPTGTPDTTPTEPEPAKSMRFFLSAQLDTTRVNRDVQRILEEIVVHLTQEPDVTMEIRLEVAATAPKGISQQTVRAVSENCRTLKLGDFGFEN